MNRLESLIKKLKNRERVLSTTLVSPIWPAAVEVLARTPLDCLVLDTEHGVLSGETCEPLLHTARLVGLPTIVRLPDVVPNYVSKIIDMGADGVMLPRIESEAQLEAAVRALRYAPRGRKGVGGFSFLRADESFGEINDHRLMWMQIESPAGMAALPGMLERFKDDIACVIIGPYDLSTMTGTPLDVKCEAMQGYARRIFDICKTHGVSCGVYVDGPDDLAHWDALGANVFWSGTELSMLSLAATELHKKFLQL